MRPDDEEDPGESFADLIGETRPLRSKAEHVVLPASKTRAAHSPHARTHSDTSRSSFARFRWPDPEEPRLAAASGISDRQLADLGRGNPEPEERIDLHGVRSGAAARILAQRLESAVARRLRCVLIIHGRGKSSEGGHAILRERLPNWLTNSREARSVLAFAPAPTRLGGEGAMLVLLEPLD